MNTKTMRNTLLILLAATLFVACSKETATDDVNKGKVNATATFKTIDQHPDHNDSEQGPGFPPMIGVTIGGDTLTEYSWEAGDGFAITSKAGVGASEPEWMFAGAAGSTDVYYYGFFEAVATHDTYYAVYPYNSTLVGGNRDHYYAGEFWVDYSVQSGMDRDAALLTAMVKDATIDKLDFDFYPTNAILYVSVNGLPKNETLQSVILRQTSGESFTTKFQWDILNNRVAGRYSSSQITVEQPDNNFFIALPPYLELSEFSLTFKTNTKEVIKIYDGRFFDKGYTYRSIIEWEETIKPTVVCGAKTSYDLYLEGKSDIANKMVNAAVLVGAGFNYDGNSYETESYSTYINVADEDISSAGVVLKNMATRREHDIKLSFGDGYIGRDDWTVADYSIIDWTEYTATAYLILNDGTRVESEPTTHYVTGFPYDSRKGEFHGFYTEDNWDFNGTYSSLRFPWRDISNGVSDLVNSFIFFQEHDGLLLEGGLRWAQVLSPQFFIPNNDLYIKANWEISSRWTAREANIALLRSTNNGGDADDEIFAYDPGDAEHYKMTSEPFAMDPDYPCFQIELQVAFRGPWAHVHHLVLEYN